MYRAGKRNQSLPSDCLPGYRMKIVLKSPPAVKQTARSTAVMLLKVCIVQ